MSGSEPTVLALDFDGVICDGLREYFVTAWRAYCRIWQPIEPTPPPELAEQFYGLRPVVETGWEMPVLLRAILEGFPAEKLFVDWAAIAQNILLSDNLKPTQLAIEVDDVRDQWIAADLEGWLAEHRFYPGAIKRLQQILSSTTQVFIISTKEGRFIDQLLRQQGVELAIAQIFGKEANRPKHQVLRELMQNYGSTASFWFIEDRVRTLQAIKLLPDLEQVRLFLAAWGYNTLADRTAADQDSRIQLLKLEKFVQDFASW